MISYIQIIDVFKSFATQHLQIQKFDFEFREQMPNLATVDEAYPMLFLVPVGGSILENVREFDLDVYCVDRYQNDRTNVKYVISDTDLILGDLSRWLEEGQDDIEVVRTYSTTPINNDLLDYVGGHVMRLRVQVDRIALCEIPFDGSAPVPPSCPSAIVRNSDGTWTDVVASGGTLIVPDTPVTVTDTDGNTLSTSDVVSVTGGSVVAPDASYLVQYENGTPIQSGTILSGGSEVIQVPDPIVCEDATVINSDATYTDTIASGGTLVLPDSDVNVNGSLEGAVVSVKDIDINLTDGVNPVTPVSVGVVGNTVTVEVPAASTGWVRNPDWLPLPEITASDNRFVGLFLVFEGEYNQAIIAASGTAYDLLIDWGDGTSQNVTTNTSVLKVFDYSSITSAVKQYYDGRNYKQVIIDCQLLSGTLTSFSPAGVLTINNPGKRNFADICMSFQNVVTSYISGGNFASMVYLERFRFLNHSITMSNGLQFSITPSLRFFELKKEGVLSFNGRFQLMGCVDIGDFIADDANDGSAFQQVFLSGKITSVGYVSGALTPNATQMFRLCVNLTKIGNVNLPVCTNANNFASDCNSLQSVGIIYAPLLTNITSFFFGCSSLLSAHFSSCANITTTTNAFGSCRNLSRLIMTGMRVGFSIQNCNLTAQALNNLFNSLGTAAGSQTIIVTGNPGAATCDTSIATAKGFAVTI